MKNRKIAAFLAAGTLIMAMDVTTAFAAAPAEGIPYCPISDCMETACHEHEGMTYAAHAYDDGHTYHNFCGVSGCAQTGEHTHHNERAQGGHHGHGSRSHHG